MKNRIISFYVFLFCSMNISAQWDDYINYDDGSFIDDRDGREYNWVKIGKQVWMSENLDIGRIIYVIDGKITDCSIEKFCYDDKEENCNKYGGLYTNQLIDFYTPYEGARSICPEGWHLPSENEWLSLVNYLGGPEVAGDAMKVAGKYKSNKSTVGEDRLSGFSALPGGYCMCSKDGFTYSKIGKGCCFWSSTARFSLISLNNDFQTICLFKNKSHIASDRSYGNSAHSVRCVKD